MIITLMCDRKRASFPLVMRFVKNWQKRLPGQALSFWRYRSGLLRPDAGNSPAYRRRALSPIPDRPSDLLFVIKTSCSSSVILFPATLWPVVNFRAGCGVCPLFEGRYWLILPNGADTESGGFGRIIDLVRAMTEQMTADYHDLALAITSHLPHLIAYTIVGTAVDLEQDLKNDVIRFSASGFLILPVLPR